MRETKGQLKQRLKTTGKWDAFTLHREGLVSGGMDPGEAWVAAAAEFPPGEGELPRDRWGERGAGGVGKQEVSSVPEIEVASAAAFADRKPASERDVVRWVFENMAVEVTAADAPNGGAWGLLQACRGDANLYRGFYLSVWAKLLPNRAQMDAEERLAADVNGEAQLALIARIQQLREDAVL